MYLTGVFVNRMIPRLRGCSNDLGLDLPSIILSDPNDLSFEAFYTQFPAFYTYATLCFANDATDIEPELNDVLDLSQLSVAAPYADIVVTEQFFGSMLKKFEIDEMFETSIFIDVGHFKQFLAETVD